MEASYVIKQVELSDEYSHGTIMQTEKTKSNFLLR